MHQCMPKHRISEIVVKTGSLSSKPRVVLTTLLPPTPSYYLFPLFSFISTLCLFSSISFFLHTLLFYHLHLFNLPYTSLFFCLFCLSHLPSFYLCELFCFTLSLFPCIYSIFVSLTFTTFFLLPHFNYISLSHFQNRHSFIFKKKLATACMSS